ncbi:MAG: hypothetical protein EOP09_04050 [Proteobacteria bacterium]|nr:MAG: hypothetical protein EOP09_04050 [Pseudomonadota bacterium]
MELFFTLFERILPLICLIGLGFIAGRVIKVDRESIARLLIYMIAPVVFFSSIVNLKWRHEYSFGPFLVFFICTLVAVVFKLLSYRSFGSVQSGLIGFASGNANSGYFGVPLALALYGEEGVSLLILIMMGFTLYENTVGFYLLAQGKYGPKDALRKLVKLPALYALLLAGIVKIMGFRLTGVLLDWTQYFRGAYSILGMMLIGLGLSQARGIKLDLRLNTVLFLGKFVAWPLTAFAVIRLDVWLGFHWLPDEARPLVMLLACCPLAANTVAFASFLHLEVERVSSAVLLSTVFGVVWIPLLLTVLK